MREHVDTDRVKQAVDEALTDAAILDGRSDNRLVLTAKAAVVGALKRSVTFGWSPDGYLRADTRRNPEDPSRLDVRVTRNLKDFPMDAEDYEDMFGEAPQNDDLERLNCQESGEHGHLMCGYCVWCGDRRWECVCPMETVRREQPGND